VRGAPAWLRAETAKVEAQATSLLRLTVPREAPPGPQEGTLELEVENLHIGPGRNLSVALPVRVTIGES
jgi:hypothetical protein